MVAGLLNVVIFPTDVIIWHRLTSWIIKWRRFYSAERHSLTYWSRSVPDAERANPVGLLEEALVDVIAADPIHSGSVKIWVKTCHLPVWMNWPQRAGEGAD